MRALTSVEAGNFKIVADILGIVWRLNKLGKLGSQTTLCFSCRKKRLGTISDRPNDHGKCNINANQNARGREYFSTSLVGAVGTCERLLDFLGNI